MNTLTIDIGNSKIKLDYWANDGILLRSESDFLPMDEIKRRVEGIDIKGIIVSSVRTGNEDIIKALRDESGCATIIDFNREEVDKYKDKIKYKGNIGYDRVAAYIGGEALLPNRAKLIVDAGTAITLDIVDKEGNYRGGNISLGLYSRMKALADATSLLPKVKEAFLTSFFGDNTASAIKSGAINGVTGEVLYTIEIAKQAHDIEWVVITGGDSDMFLRTVWNKWEKCFPDEDLVGRGLNYHLRKYYFPEVFLHTKFLPSL